MNENKIAIGSISHGTLNNRDLLPAFLFALEDYDQKRATQFGAELIELGFGYSQCGVAFGDADDWPVSPDDGQVCDILAEIRDTLDALAPDYVRFGAHDGDGSDFGFWPEHEAIDEGIYDEELKKITDLSQAESDGTYLLVTDHGNMSLYTVSAGIASEIWSCV